MNFCYCITLPAFDIVSVLNFCHSYRDVVVFLTLNYIMTYDVEYVFIRRFHHILNLGKVCVQVFGPSFSWVTFLVLSLIVHTFWIAVLYHSLMDHCLVVVKGLA